MPQGAGVGGRAASPGSSREAWRVPRTSPRPRSVRFPPAARRGEACVPEAVTPTTGGVRIRASGGRCPLWACAEERPPAVPRDSPARLWRRDGRAAPPARLEMLARPLLGARRCDQKPCPAGPGRRRPAFRPSALAVSRPPSPVGVKLSCRLLFLDRLAIA